jgi:hypothetical protein
MSNPFDQFDAPPSANPFDQFDAPKPTPTPAENSLWDEAKRQGGLGVRTLVNAAASPLTLGGNALGKAVNAVAGRQVFQPSTDTLDAWMTKAGLPEAERPIEKMTQSVAHVVLPAGALPLTMPAQLLGNAAIGAADAPAGQEGIQSLIGGASGVVGGGLARAMGGFKPTKEAQVLMDQGVQPTVGQSVGGILNKMEQKATSIPLVGDAVSYARNRASKEFQQKVVGRATQGGAKTVDEANNFASGLYNEVVPSLSPTRDAVVGVQQKLNDAMQNPELTAEGKQMLVGLVQKHFANFGQLDGQGIKKLDSELGYLARKYAAGDPAAKTLSSELYNVQQAFREGLETGLPAELQGKLRTANQIWRDLIPVNKAASARADEVITPRALQKAMARQQRTDVTRMAYDPLVDSAVKVLPSTVPDSGTAGRLMLGAGGLTGAAALDQMPLYLGAGALAGVGATRPVQQFLTGQVSWQKAYVDALRRSLPTAVRNDKNAIERGDYGNE